MISGEVLVRLRALEERLGGALGDAVTVRREDWGLGGDTHVVRVVPTNPRSRAFAWIWIDEVVLEIGRPGGRWELQNTAEDLQFMTEVVEAVVAGRVIETFAPGRSSVVVTLSDGSTARETGYNGCLSSLVVLPGWRRWGRSVHYEPYV